MNQKERQVGITNGNDNLFLKEKEIFDIIAKERLNEITILTN